MSHSRRQFLTRASAVAAAGLLAQLPARGLWATTPAALIPPPDETLLRELAQQAIDAARAGGASFADIRLTAGRAVAVGAFYNKGTPPHVGMLSLEVPTGYCVRAIVDGAWGFARGTDILAGAVVESARSAVAVAKGNRPRHRRAMDLAPADLVVNGVWEAPIDQDPLTVSLGDQAELGLAALNEVVHMPEVDRAQMQCVWRRPVSIFASTDGTLITFRHATAMPGALVHVSLGPSLADEGGDSVEGLLEGAHGYEALKGRTMVTGMRPAAERAIARVKAARNATSVDVGRYDLVLSPLAMGKVLHGTIAAALNAESALGYHAHGAGISFANPPLEMLGQYQIASPLITVTADRTRPGGAATVGWDEEGVKPRRYTLVDRGVVADYHTNRQTAAEIGEWYRQRGQPVRSHGIARECGAERPVILLPNMTLEPGADPVSVEEMVKDVKKGLYVESAGGGADQQLLNAQFNMAYNQARKITNGKLGGYVKDAAFQFLTVPFWKSIDAVGGRGSAQTMVWQTDMTAVRDSLQPFPFSTFEMVPARARRVNVLNTGRMA